LKKKKRGATLGLGFLEWMAIPGPLLS